MEHRMRLLFLGSGEFGLPTLQKLVGSHDVCAVISATDRPAGRNQKVTPTSISAWASQNEIEVLPTENVNSLEMIGKIDSFEVDAMVVIAFGQKLSDEVIGNRFAINLHASLLPRWRGASPINAAILQGDKESGVSVITLAQQMDGGSVLAQQTTPIGQIETAGELHDRLSMLGTDLVLDVLAGKNTSIDQDETLVTYAPKISRADAILDLQQDAEVVSRTIRGFSPWPGCHLQIANIDCKLLNAVASDGSGNPGEILEDGSIAVGRGSVVITQLQPAGSKPMSWKDFCNGRSVNSGDQCGVQP
jgi:methionyl-tRNA formyltransferase